MHRCYGQSDMSATQFRAENLNPYGVREKGTRKVEQETATRLRAIMHALEDGN